jgi:biopolymer transport protein ExbD
MAISTGENDDVVSEINVTPLVDVMLVLLVVFIVTAPLLTNVIKVTLPSTAKTTAQFEQQKKPLVISVDQAGKIYVDKTEIALARLEPRLRELRAGDSDLAVSLSADESSNYGVVAKVMAAINRSGVTKLSVLSVVE